jgi:hypothetical protein
MLLYLASAVFLSGPSPLVLATIFYCLRFETSLFVASYDSQGHGGDIRPPHHKGKLSIILGFSLYRLRSENTYVTQQWIYANHIGNIASSVVIFTAPLHRNGSYPIVACIFIVTGMCLPCRCLAMGLNVTICCCMYNDWYHLHLHLHDLRALDFRL